MPRLTDADTEVKAKTRFIDDLDVEVSTVAYYHRAGYTSETPIYYETMVFAKGYPEIDQGGNPNARPETCGCDDDVMAMHNRVVERIESFLQARARQTIVQ